MGFDSGLFPIMDFPSTADNLMFPPIEIRGKYGNYTALYYGGSAPSNRHYCHLGRERGPNTDANADANAQPYPNASANAHPNANADRFPESDAKSDCCACRSICAFPTVDDRLCKRGNESDRAACR
jgi:hypothetical protein